MPITWKILILAAVALGDLLAFALIAPRMIRQGKPLAALIIGVAMVVSMALVGAVLFFFVE